MGRSILSVIVGYLVMAIAIMALFAIWFRGKVTPPSDGFMLFSLGYGFVFAVVGGYVTAMIAKRSEMKHAMALAVFSVLMGIVSMVASAGQEPFWYQIANMVVMVSAVVLGGYLRVRQVRKARGPGGLGTTA